MKATIFKPSSFPVGLLQSLLKRLLSIPRNIYLALSNRIDPIGHARRLGVRVGHNCRISHTAEFGTEPYLITIGDHVTITNYVRFINHDGGVWVFRDSDPDIEVFGTIKIGNNSFIGLGSIILPNVTIGANCIVGAGAVVTKDIPDNSIAVGIPARVIKNIDEYLVSVKQNANTFHIRHLSDFEKRRILLQHFGIEKVVNAQD